MTGSTSASSQDGNDGREDTGWVCGRSQEMGGKCVDGPGSDGTCCKVSDACLPVRSLRAQRTLAAKWVAVFVFGAVVLAASYAERTEFPMPGPLTAGHRLQTKCSSCHASVPDGHFGWLQTVFASSDPKKESAACLVCHKVSGEQNSPHNLSMPDLKARTEQVSDKPPSHAPTLAGRAGNAVLPSRFGNGAGDGSGVFCVTCHKEHQGTQFDLNGMANEQCQSCHVSQFKSFSKGHPEFSRYPYKRRTRIVFDHGSHFLKHFPEGLKERATAQGVPKVCTDCHSLKTDGRVMSVKPFKAVCSSCHLDQIVGTKRASGPKGVPFLSLPGLDLETLRAKGIRIGEWPSASEAEITPFVMMLIGVDDRRRELVAKVHALDLLDLSAASDADLAAVGAFVWELKTLLFELSTSKNSAITKRLRSATGARLESELAAKLVATLPRDVLLSARREWLPKLGDEIASSPATISPAWDASVDRTQNRDATRAKGTPSEDRGKPEPQAPTPNRSPATVAPPGKRSNLLPAGQAAVLDSNGRRSAPERRVQNAQAAPSTDARGWHVNPLGELVKGNNDTRRVPDDSRTLRPLEPAVVDKVGSETRAGTASGAGEKLEIDAETWAEFGGWYRRDYAILYKPTGHADAFMRAWLDFSGRMNGGAKKNTAAVVFDLLTHKDAQGQCTKCHSVDQGLDHRRVIEWGTSPAEAKSGRLTFFKHAPHFSSLDKRGCMTCHKLNEGAKFLDGYRQGDPLAFVSNFKPMAKKQCATCHTENGAREDCQLCHTYHVDVVTSPIVRTKVPDK